MTAGTSAARAPLAAPTALLAGLSACEQLLNQHLGAVEQAFGGAGLGVIDLPSLGPEPIIAAQIRVAAALLWCRELELVGLLPFVEALAEALAQGSLPLPLGASMRRLMPFWKDSEKRLTASERHAIYQQTFPGSIDAGLDALVDTLLAIGRADRDREPSGLRAALGRIAVELGQSTSERAVGIAGFAARDIVSQISEALDVLREPELRQALGSDNTWTLLSRWGPRLLGRAPDVTTHLARAESGRELLRWLADSAPDVASAARRVDRAHPLVHAAERWRVATPRAS